MSLEGNENHLEYFLFEQKKTTYDSHCLLRTYLVLGKKKKEIVHRIFFSQDKLKVVYHNHITPQGKIRFPAEAEERN